MGSSGPSGWMCLGMKRTAPQDTAPTANNKGAMSPLLQSGSVHRSSAPSQPQDSLRRCSVSLSHPSSQLAPPHDASTRPTNALR
jgi:hypothetical protein